MNTKAELKQGLLDLCIRSGFITLAEILDEEIKARCGGAWYAHGDDRGAYRWGRTNGQVVLGGRKLGKVQQVSKNVKRWRIGGIAVRWAALGLMEAKKRFRRIKGYSDIPILIAALKKKNGP